MINSNAPTLDPEDLYSEAAALLPSGVDLAEVWLDGAKRFWTGPGEAALFLRACTVLEAASVRAVGMSAGAHATAADLTADACLAAADVIALCRTEIRHADLRRELMLHAPASPPDATDRHLRHAHRFARRALRLRAWSALQHIGASPVLFSSLRDRIEQAAAMHLAASRYARRESTVREVLPFYRRRLQQWLEMNRIRAEPIGRNGHDMLVEDAASGLGRVGSEETDRRLSDQPGADKRSEM